MDIRKQRTATGRLELAIGPECERDEFMRRAAAVVQHFGMTVIETVDGAETLLLLASKGNNEFCLSWDLWLREVTVMAWGGTADDAVERLAANNCR